MYEDLLKKMKKCKECLCGECEYEYLGKRSNYVKCMDKLMEEAADAIEELQKLTCAQLDIIKQYQAYLTKHRWIPVTERLPKADEHDARGFAVPYLVMNGWMMVTARRTKDYWVLFGKGTVLEYVTHWMPFPEPPKEEA